VNLHYNEENNTEELIMEEPTMEEPTMEEPQELIENDLYSDRLAKLLPTTIAILASLTLAIMARHHFVVDTDPLWAYTVGNYIVHHGFPHVDYWAWTTYGKPWQAWEWGWDVLLYLFSSSWGLGGSIVLMAFFLSALSISLYSTLRRINKSNAVILYLMVVWFLGIFAMLRPQIISYTLFCVILYYVLFQSANKYWNLIVIPILIVIWANSHESVLLGLGIIWMFFILKIIRKEFDKTKIIYPVIYSLLTLINPYGYLIWPYTIKAVNVPLWNQFISEWTPLNFGNSFEVSIMAIVLITSLIVIRKSDNFLKTTENIFILIFYIGCVYEGVRHARFLPYLAIVWSIFMAQNLPNDWFGLGETVSSILTRLNQYETNATWFHKVMNLVESIRVEIINRSKGFLVSSVFIALLFLYTLSYSVIVGNSITSSAAFPVTSTNILKSLGLDEHLFNNYDWGGYLIYNGVKPFIDGRADVFTFESSVFEDYMNAAYIRENPMVVFNKYNIQTLLVARNSLLYNWLISTNYFNLIYQDDTAAIFTRNPKYKNITFNQIKKKFNIGNVTN